MPEHFPFNNHVLTYSGTLLLGALFGVIGYRIIVLNQEQFQPLIQHTSSSEGSLTNPILDCELFPKTQAPLYRKIEQKIQISTDEALTSDMLTDISVYFRDLNSGAWVGQNEKAEFSPASMLKVPILMAYYKVATEDPAILTKKLKYLKDSNSTAVGLRQNIVPTSSLTSGEEYSVDELIRSMIVNSDNDSQYALILDMPAEKLDDVYTDLGLEVPGVRKSEDFMTVREYAAFFRILYNSTFLNRDYSEKALKLLSEIDFADGLRKGVPDDIAIAHKFGERGVARYQGGPEVKQLHDCGIIYYPDSPYLLCIMTRGTDFKEQSTVIQEISRDVYGTILEHNLSTSSQNQLDSN